MSVDLNPCVPLNIAPDSLEALKTMTCDYLASQVYLVFSAEKGASGLPDLTLQRVNGAFQIQQAQAGFSDFRITDGIAKQVLKLENDARNLFDACFGEMTSTVQLISGDDARIAEEICQTSITEAELDKAGVTTTDHVLPRLDVSACIVSRIAEQNEKLSKLKLLQAGKTGGGAFANDQKQSLLHKFVLERRLLNEN
jgi:hypothetical protein